MKSLTAKRPNLKAHDSFENQHLQGHQVCVILNNLAALGGFQFFHTGVTHLVFEGWKQYYVHQKKGSKSSLKCLYSGKNLENFSWGGCPQTLVKWGTVAPTPPAHVAVGPSQMSFVTPKDYPWLRGCCEAYMGR